MYIATPPHLRMSPQRSAIGLTLKPSQLNKYHIADARQLRQLFGSERAFVDTTITSPPYWNIKDYGRARQIGFGQSYERYLGDIEAVFAYLYEVTKNSGSLWIISDTLKEDGELRLLPFDIAARLKRVGWILQDVVIWQKDRTLPWSHQGKLRNIFEYVSLFTKTRKFKYRVDRVRDISDLKNYWIDYPERYNPAGRAPARTWHVPIPRQGSWGEAGNFVRHACPLPSALVERMIKLTSDPGDLVFDPFAGSGAVLATAAGLGRSFLGVDLNSDYRGMFLRTVLPTIKKTYLKDGTANKTATRTVKAFGRTIRTLRLLKYPKEVVRLYRARFGQLRCRAVWVLPAQQRHPPLLIFQFASAAHIPRSFSVNVSKVCSVKPLSKFEVACNIETAATPTALRRVLKLRGLGDDAVVYRYTGGRFYTWNARTRVGVALAASTEFSVARHPVLLSPLRVSIDKGNPERFFDDLKSP